MSEASGRWSPILDKLADLYAASVAGSTGAASRHFGVRFVDLLELAGCTKGDAYSVALTDLQRARQRGAIEITEHGRSKDWQRVVVPISCEAELFALIGRTPPTMERERWAALFAEAGTWAVPDRYRESWERYCHERAASAKAGEGWKPFRRSQLRRARTLLELTARLLAWDHPSLLRTASAHLTGSSKFLERCIATLQMLLGATSGGKVTGLADLNVLHNPSSVRFHGPLRILLRGIWTDYGNHAGECSLAESDLASIEQLECGAERAVSIENATKFHELCQLGCGDLLVFTSYPNRATVAFLRRLPVELPLFHFGDTDPWGFDVLRSLRGAVSRPIAPLHMRFRPSERAEALTARDRRKLERLLVEPMLADVRAELVKIEAAGNKGDFEQESLIVTGQFPYAGALDDK